MALSEKEKELYRVLYSEKLNVIREKSLIEKGKIHWLPDSSESERLHLDIERRKQDLKETLDAYVVSLIETLQKVGKNVDDSDFKELGETLKLIVNSELKNFSSQYKNNILSSLHESTIDANIYVLENELPSLIPKALLPVSKFKIETELLNNKSLTDDYDKALEIIKDTMLLQSRTPIPLAKHDEDAYRKIIANGLGVIYKGQVTLESLNKKGKTDILLRINNKNVLIAECKIWSKEEDFNSAINQLLGRYLEWHDDKAVLVVFCRNESLTRMLSKVKEITELHSQHSQTLDFAEEGEFRFLFCHPEDDNRKLILSVIAFKIPKNRKLNEIDS